MIDEATRTRWSKLFADATRGPWVHDPANNHVRTVTGELIAVPTDTTGGRPGDAEDMRLCAEAREAWPLTMAALDASEAECRGLRDLFETQQTSLKQELDHARAEITNHDAQVSEARSLMFEAAEANRILIARHDMLQQRIARLTELADAVAKWAKHRHGPSLREAWDRYLAASMTPQ